MARTGKKKKKTDPDGRDRTLVRNRQALHNYRISERMEAGLVLVGSEVKSLRASHASIREAYVEVRGGEAWLINATIDEYPWANIENHDINRKRKLLLHKRQIKQIEKEVTRKGRTAVPIAIYLKSGKIKLEVGIGVGKQDHEKRQAKKEKDAKREIERALSQRR